MATREMTGIGELGIGRAAAAAVVAVIVGLTTAILVAAAMFFGSAETSGGSSLTRADDWGTRHPAVRTSVPLGPQDDYPLRHPSR